MKKLLAVTAVTALAWFAFNSTRAEAVPACVPRDEKLALILPTASYNNQPGTQSAGSRLFVTDAGVQFYVDLSGELSAVPVTGATTCPAPAEEVTITATDPWTGERITVSVSGTP